MNQTLTITSKNQITLPANYVRLVGLGKHRRMNVQIRGEEIILKPEKSLESRAKDAWSKLPNFIGTSSDLELRAAIRESSSARE